MDQQIQLTHHVLVNQDTHTIVHQMNVYLIQDVVQDNGEDKMDVKHVQQDLLVQETEIK